MAINRRENFEQRGFAVPPSATIFGRVPRNCWLLLAVQALSVQPHARPALRDFQDLL